MIGLLIRDLRLAVKAGGGFGLALAFFLIVSVLVPCGIGPETGLLREVSGGVLWLGALLACLLSLDRIFALDWEDGSLELLATSPLPLEMVAITKSAAHWITTGLPLALVAPLLGLLLLAAFAPRTWLRRPALGALGAIGLVATLLPLTTGPAPSLAFPWLFPLGTVTFLALTVLPKRASQGAS